MAKANSTVAPAAPRGSKRHSTKARHAPIDMQPDTPAHYASNYFAQLIEDPQSVELGGYLTALAQTLGTDDTTLQCFGETLQGHIEGLVRQVKDRGIPAPAATQATGLLDRIAGTALSMSKLSMTADDDPGTVADALLAMSEKVGYLADKATQLLGGGGRRVRHL
jgi:hypothetical protein